MDTPVLTHHGEADWLRLVAVGEIETTRRAASAAGRLGARPEPLTTRYERIRPQGDTLTVARIAGIPASHTTLDLVPLRPPLPIDGFTVDLVPDRTIHGTTTSATGNDHVLAAVTWRDTV